MKILVVDDEARYCQLVADHLRDAGHDVVTETSGEAAAKLLETLRFDVVVTDLVMKPVDGMAVLEAARKAHPDTDVVMLTAHGTIPTAVAAMRAGADDFIIKGVSLEELALRIERIAERRRLRRENAALKQELAVSDRYAEMVGSSPALNRVRELVQKVAPSDATVLILGESGVGKELVARLIHRLSPRAARPFAVVHAAALPETLLESELFGYEKGAFTGASGRKPGRLESAAGGTLFLDEIGDISAPLQVKLLRFLQDRTFNRLGSSDTVAVDARIICATNTDLQAAVQDGRFREDLYYRLAVFPMKVPPLRERREDIPALAAHILARLGYNRPLAGPVLKLLAEHDWPGNVRELENVLERALILSAGSEIGPQHIQLPEPVLAQGSPAGSLFDVERRMLEEALAKSGGNKSKAARLLGITRRMLYTKLARYGIACDEEK
ncbi:MAG: sigma-54 dependent transcriptional regulator [candidate division WOR-3 bacterium]